MPAKHLFDPPPNHSTNREQPLLRMVIPEVTEIASLQVKSDSHPRYNARLVAWSPDGFTEIQLFPKPVHSWDTLNTEPNSLHPAPSPLSGRPRPARILASMLRPVSDRNQLCQTTLVGSFVGARPLVAA
jgi:hypothetical protein